VLVFSVERTSCGRELIPHLGSGDLEDSLTKQQSGAWHV